MRVLPKVYHKQVKKAKRLSRLVVFKAGGKVVAWLSRLAECGAGVVLPVVARLCILSLGCGVACRVHQRKKT
jgi:hypothetical protein